jgi:hypothetical protein
VCEDCYRIEKRIDHIEARGSKFCTKRTLPPCSLIHADTDVDADQCPATAASGIKCSIRKKVSEERCSFRKLIVPILNVAVADSTIRLSPCLHRTGMQEGGLR